MKHDQIELTQIDRLSYDFNTITTRLHSAQATGKPTDSLRKEFQETWIELKALVEKPIRPAHDPTFGMIQSEIAAARQAEINAMGNVHNGD